MTHLTYSGLFCFFLSTERIDERNIKAPTATSECRPTSSEVAWVFFWEIMPPCRSPTGSKLRNVQLLLTFLMCVNLQHFVTERDTRACVGNISKQPGLVVNALLTKEVGREVGVDVG